MNIKFQPRFVRFSKIAGIVISAAVAAILLWIFLGSILRVILFAVILAAAVCAVIAVGALLRFAATAGLHKLFSLAVVLPPRKERPARTIAWKRRLIVLSALLVVGGGVLEVFHRQMQKQEEPLFERFRQTAHCHSYSVAYDETVLEERDALAKQNGFAVLAIPLLGWYQFCDSKSVIDNKDGTADRAVYLRVPWR